MIFKGSLLALLIAGAYAYDNHSPDNSGYDDADETVSYPVRRRYGGGKPTQVSGSTWGSSRAQTGRVRAKAARRRRWGRPARPANNNWDKPSEPESWEATTDTYSSDKPAEPDWVSPSYDKDTHKPTPAPTKNSYQVCDKVGPSSHSLT